jgi:hypothetical protein
MAQYFEKYERICEDANTCPNRCSFVCTGQPLYTVRCAHNVFLKNPSAPEQSPGSFIPSRQCYVLCLSLLSSSAVALVTVGDHRGPSSSELLPHMCPSSFLPSGERLPSSSLSLSLWYFLPRDEELPSWCFQFKFCEIYEILACMSVCVSGTLVFSPCR